MRTCLNHVLVILLATMVASTAFAADHLDSSTARAEPGADITDVFAFMSEDASKINLIMNVVPFAGADAAFSDAVLYAFHVNSGATFQDTNATETLVICSFDGSGFGTVSCWAGDEYVTGDASDPAGISSASGYLKVFAGLRNDPFFFDLEGFDNAIGTTINAVPALVEAEAFDEAGCPALDEDTSGALLGLLGGGNDTFAGANVMSLVVQVDKSVVNGGGPILGVWGSTNRAAE